MENITQIQSGSSAPHGSSTPSAVGDAPNHSINPSSEEMTLEAPESFAQPHPQPHDVNASATSAPTASPATRDESSINANEIEFPSNSMGDLAPQPGAIADVDDSIIFAADRDLATAAASPAAPFTIAAATETGAADVSAAYDATGADPAVVAAHDVPMPSTASAGASVSAAVAHDVSATSAATPAAGHIPHLHGDHDPSSFENIDAHLLSHESEDAIAASAAGLLNDVPGYDLDAEMAAAHPHHHSHQDMALEDHLFESTMESLVNLDEDVEVEDGKNDHEEREVGLGAGTSSGFVTVAGTAAATAAPAAAAVQAAPDGQTPFSTAALPKPLPAAPAPAAAATNTPEVSILSPQTAGPSPSALPSIQPGPLAPSRPQLSSPSTNAVAQTGISIHPSPTPLPQPPKPTETHLRRAILTNTYSPYIHPTDTSLSSARQRLRTALEQTRQLRQAFTESAYDKYRVILLPVPSSIEEITEEIEKDPVRAMQELAVAKEALRVEKEREKREGLPLQGSGVGGGGKSDGAVGAASAKDDFDQFAYYGSGLNLVVLPEHPAEGSVVDFSKYSQRGPTDPMTGQRYEGVTSAAAAAAELVFDRVRRCHVARLDKDLDGLGAGGMLAGGVMLPYGGDSAGTRVIAENLGPDMRKSPDVMISPALSLDSATGAVRSRSVGKMPLGQGQQLPQSSLLSLSPDAEGTRPDGKMTAVQAALISKGVGLKEMRMDPRMKAIHRHQRLGHVDLRYGLPASGSLLPPLLRVHQIQQIKPAGVRESEAGQDRSSAARGAIQTVVEHINNAEDLEGKFLDDLFVTTSIEAEKERLMGGGKRVAFQPENSVSEVEFLRKLREGKKAEVRMACNPDFGGPANESKRKRELNDPLLAFSVMSALGLTHERVSNASSSDIESEMLGLGKLKSLEIVSEFFKDKSSQGTKRSFMEAFATPRYSRTKGFIV